MLGPLTDPNISIWSPSGEHLEERGHFTEPWYRNQVILLSTKYLATCSRIWVCLVRATGIGASGGKLRARL